MIGKTILNYRITSFIDEGGMGSIYSGIHMLDEFNKNIGILGLALSLHMKNICVTNQCTRPASKKQCMNSS